MATKNQAPSIARTPPIFIAGPTAAGKSEIALTLAERIGGEIISVDSMQVYRGLDIGTAKPSATERERIPHHLIDVASVTEAFDAAKYVALARAAESDIRARGRVPIFCGGTGLYFKSYLEGLGEAPPANPELRAELDALPLETLLAELRTHDPKTFAVIDQKNPRRVVRAIEVIRLTGRPFSEQRSNWSNASGIAHHAGRFFGIARPAEGLRQRISVRVDEMFRRGLVKETERLLEHGFAQNPTAMQAIGYRQVVEHLRGERSLEETIDLVKSRTRQFAKRQHTWFRKYAPETWIEVTSELKIEVVLDQIMTTTTVFSPDV
jgi:tRNA dimethylallyltransferase